MEILNTYETIIFLLAVILFLTAITAMHFNKKYKEAIIDLNCTTSSLEMEVLKNKKLKKKNTKLETQVFEQTKEIKKLQFQLDNKPHFSIGSSINEYEKVVAIEVVTPSIVRNFINNAINYFQSNKRDTKSITLDLDTKPYYQYTLQNIFTDEKRTLKENELLISHFVAKES